MTASRRNATIARALSRAVYLIMLLTAITASAAEFHLPFNGRWFVAQGGDTPNVNHHMLARAQAYGVDLARVGGPAERALARGDGSRLEDFYSWQQPVLAPVDGVATIIVDSYPDNPLGTRDEKHPFGNVVVIRTSDNRYVFLAHLANGSIKIKSGDRLRSGELVGLCGNSGNSDFPHIHMHVQDSLGSDATGLNVVFSHIDVELSGKKFSDVEWPLIRGLFVSNSR